MIDRSLFKVEDFLIDNTFQSYCAGTDPLCVSYWRKWIESHPEQQPVIQEAERLYKILSGHKKPLDKQVNEFKSKTELTDVGSRQPTTVSIKKRYRWVPAAAAIGLIFCSIALYQFYFQSEVPKEAQVTSFRTKAGEKKKITLTDGSVVLLNAASSLKIAQDFNIETREVTLIGEAYFDVSHNKDKPFKVITEDFDINVLGTTFNVKVYPGEATSEATLINGLIQMEGKGAKASSITLKPSQKVIFHKVVETVQDRKAIKPSLSQPEISINHYTKVKDSSIVEMAWTQNRLEILDQDFTEIKTVLERWYDVEIVFADPELEKYRFTATFNDENIDQVLSALQKAEHFKYEIKGKKITISKE